MYHRRLAHSSLLCVATIALCASAALSDRVMVTTSRGCAYLTLTADAWGRGWLYDGEANQFPDERPIVELYLCLERGTIQKWAAPQGWIAEVSGREITWRTDNSACAIPFGALLSGFMVKASGKGFGSWVTRAGDGEDIAFDFVSLK